MAEIAAAASPGRAFQTKTIRLRGLPERVFRHRGTPADIGVMRQMFELEHYALRRLKRAAEIQALYRRMVAQKERPFILDAGANIGGSVVYFGLHFPDAHIVALEPAANNFAVLEANTVGMDADLRCAAIGAVAGSASLADPGMGEWAYRVQSGGGGEQMPVLAAAQLVAEKRAAGYRPFIAKVDIEGGEGDLFSADTGWVDDFPLLIIELHDWLLPRSANSRNFLKCIAGLERDFVHIGENIFSIGNQWTA
jgi:FkbM family methyltransferase